MPEMPETLRRPRILVTGFEPFGSDSENASAEAVRLLSESWDPDAEGADLFVGILPVSFVRAGVRLKDLITAHDPDAVLAVGEAGGRASITPERVAVNEMDARIPDNDGAQPRGIPIDLEGPASRPSGLDPEHQAEILRRAGMPAEVSEDAGRFLCNHVAYLVSGLEVPGGFVHVPAVRSQGLASVGAETDGPSSRRAATTLQPADLSRALKVLVRDWVQSFPRGTLLPSSAGSR